MAMTTADSCAVRVIHQDRVREGRGRLLGGQTYVDLAETFRALADPSRVKIVHALREQELCVCDLAAVVGLSESAVSQHLRVLRHLKVVSSRKEGKVVYYHLEDGHIRDLFDIALSHSEHAVAPERAARWA